MRCAAAVMAAALMGASLAGPAFARPAGAGKDSRPNLLVVMTDDMTATDMEFMPKTRKLLVKQGTSFENAITSFPLCCPSRATFLTGQYAHNHGVGGNFWPEGWYGMEGRKNTISTWLDRAGYSTGFVGKWLNGYGARDGRGEIPAGWDQWHGLLDLSAYDYHNYVMNRNGKLRTWGDADFARKMVEFAEIQVVPPDAKTPAEIFAKLQEVMGPPPYSYWGTEDPKDYSPDVTGQITTKLIKGQRKSKRPFFLWWAPVAPHREDVATTLMGRPGADPRPPARHEQLSKGFELPTPLSFNEADLSDKPSNLTSTAPLMDQPMLDQLQLDYEGRGGSLHAVDDQIAKMLKTLKRTRQLRNTVIVFTSDNGWLQGEHRVTGDKFLPYEESLKVPLVLRGPGIPKGRSIARQVSNIDIPATLVALGKAKARRKLDGVNLIPGARKPKKLPNRVLGIEALRPLFTGPIPNNAWDRPYKGVRTERYTYVVWTETGEKELYDRQADPFQLENVADEPAYAAIQAGLAAKLARIESCRGRSCNVKP